jgi:hypothetical protein
MVGMAWLLAWRVTAHLPSTTTLPAGAAAVAEIADVAANVELQAPVAQEPGA